MEVFRFGGFGRDAVLDAVLDVLPRASRLNFRRPRPRGSAPFAVRLFKAAPVETGAAVQCLKRPQCVREIPENTFFLILYCSCLLLFIVIGINFFM